MGTIQGVQEAPPLPSGAAPTAPRVPVPEVGTATQTDDPPPVQLTLHDRGLASRLAEKESLFETARKQGQAARATRQQKATLDQAKARLEQIKLYSPYPADESPRAALIRRLIRLQEPPGDPSTLNLGPTRITPDASDQDIGRALDTVQSAQAQLGASVPEPTPQTEDPSQAVELSAGVGHTWPRGTGISNAQDIRYLRTL